jgi:hypothetical protein
LLNAKKVENLKKPGRHLDAYGLYPVLRLALILGGMLAASAAHAETDETYRLVHAIGNDEHFVDTGLSKAECEVRKREYKAVAEALGTHNESLGFGSITCLPESLFNEN